MKKVYWITGLSGAGKTTIGRALYNELKTKDKAIVFLDGDNLREVMGGVFGYTREERIKCAMCYSRLCKMLNEQGLTVICCTISMFDQIRDWNRENIEDYVEIYVKVPQAILRERDQKGMYSSGEKDMMGISISMEEPKNPDIVIENYDAVIQDAVREILNYEGNDK